MMQKPLASPRLRIPHGTLHPHGTSAVSERLRTRTVFSHRRAHTMPRTHTAPAVFECLRTHTVFSHRCGHTPPSHPRTHRCPRTRPCHKYLCPACAASTYHHFCPARGARAYERTHTHPWRIGLSAPKLPPMNIHLPVLRYAWKIWRIHSVRTHDGRERALQSYLTCRLIPQPTWKALPSAFVKFNKKITRSVIRSTLIKWFF